MSNLVSDSLVKTRSRRKNAGSRLKSLIQAEEIINYTEEDEDVDLLFQEDGTDEEFDINEEESEQQRARVSNLYMEGSSDNEVTGEDQHDEDDSPLKELQALKEVNDLMEDTAYDSDQVFSDSGDEYGDDDEDEDDEETQLQRQEKLAKRKEAKKKRAIPKIRSAPSAAVDVSKISVDSSKSMRQKRKASSLTPSETMDNLLNENRRASKRRATVQNKVELVNKLKESEKRRQAMKPKQKKKVHVMTQEERLAEAIETEKENIESLTRFKEQEIIKKEKRSQFLNRKKEILTDIVRFVSKVHYVTPEEEMKERAVLEEIERKRARRTRKRGPRKQNTIIGTTVADKSVETSNSNNNGNMDSFNPLEKKDSFSTNIAPCTAEKLDMAHKVDGHLLDNKEDIGNGNVIVPDRTLALNDTDIKMNKKCDLEPQGKSSSSDTEINENGISKQEIYEKDQVDKAVSKKFQHELGDKEIGIADTPEKLNEQKIQDIPLVEDAEQKDKKAANEALEPKESESQEDKYEEEETVLLKARKNDINEETTDIVDDSNGGENKILGEKTIEMSYRPENKKINSRNNREEAAVLIADVSEGDDKKADDVITEQVDGQRLLESVQVNVKDFTIINKDLNTRVLDRKLSIEESGANINAEKKNIDISLIHETVRSEQQQTNIDKNFKVILDEQNASTIQAEEDNINKYPPDTELSGESRQQSEEPANKQEILYGPNYKVCRNFIILENFQNQKTISNKTSLKAFMFGDQSNWTAQRKTTNIERIATIKAESNAKSSLGLSDNEEDDMLLLGTQRNLQKNDIFIPFSESKSLEFEELFKLPRFGASSDKIVINAEDTTLAKEEEKEIVIKTEAPSSVYLATGDSNSNSNNNSSDDALRKKCFITGKPALYFEPRTGIPYSSADAYKVIDMIRKGEFTWIQEEKDNIVKKETSKEVKNDGSEETRKEIPLKKKEKVVIGAYVCALSGEHRAAEGVPPGFLD